MSDKFLSKEEELECARHIQAMLKAKEKAKPTSEDLETIAQGELYLDKLVRANLRLAYKIANMYKAKFPNGGEIEDITQEALFGLTNAALKYDPERGNKFSTMATSWIYQAVSRNCTNTSRAIRLPENRAIQYSKYRSMVKELIRQGIPAEDAAVQAREKLGLSKEVLNSIMVAAVQPTSLNLSVDDASDDVEIGDIVVDENQLTPHEMLQEDERNATQDEISAVLSKIYSSLTPLQKDAMKVVNPDVFGPPLDKDGKRITIVSIARKHGVSVFLTKKAGKEAYEIFTEQIKARIPRETFLLGYSE